MDPLFGSPSFIAQGNSILENLDQRVSRPVVPISTARLSELHDKAHLATVSISGALLISIVSVAVVQGQWPSIPESMTLWASAFLSSGYARPVRQGLVDWWVNRSGKDAPATPDQFIEVMKVLDSNPQLRSTVARAVASTGGQTLTSRNAKDIIVTSQRLPRTPGLPR